MVTKHYIIHGRVQGVGYRNWATQKAGQIGVNGWVRNRADGTVEALVSGTQNQVETMETAFKKGPLLAKVSKIESEISKDTPPHGFTYKETV